MSTRVAAGNAISFVNDRNKGICPELVEVLRESNQEIPPMPLFLSAPSVDTSEKNLWPLTTVSSGGNKVDERNMVYKKNDENLNGVLAIFFFATGVFFC